MDNPVSWLILLIFAIYFGYCFFRKAIEDKEARYKEAENFWKNEYK